MFSNNLKRSVATLGVVAGLLAAAVPASALSGGISGEEMTKAIAGKAPTNAWPSKIEITSVKGAEPSRTSPPFVPGARNISIATTEVFELNTFGTLDPVEHRGGNDTQLAAGGAHGLKPDSNEVAVEGITLSHEGGIWRGIVADAGSGDDRITQAREPAPVTLLDQR